MHIESAAAEMVSIHEMDLSRLLVGLELYHRPAEMVTRSQCAQCEGLIGGVGLVRWRGEVHTAACTGVKDASRRNKTPTDEQGWWWTLPKKG